MFCSRCGQQVPESDRFCQSCGQEVGAAAFATAPTAGAGIPATVFAGGAAVAAPLPYAGFWTRFVAMLVDGLILGIPFSIVMIAAIFMMGGFGALMHRQVEENPDAAAALVGPLIAGYFAVLFFFILVEWLYFAGMESSARQATFGKSLMSLRVTNVEGQRISFGHASGRFFSKIISGMIPFAIGYIMAAFTARKQALHDMIAGTLVLKN